MTTAGVAELGGTFSIISNELREYYDIIFQNDTWGRPLKEIKILDNTFEHLYYY